MSTEYFNDPLGQSIISSFSKLELTFNSMESNFADFEKYEMDTLLAESMRQALDSFDHKQPKELLRSGASNHYDLSMMVSDDEEEDNIKYESSSSHNADMAEGEQFDSLMKLGVGTAKQRPEEDEWDDDDDAGYILITISTEEFFEMEEACAGRMVYEEELKQETDTWVKETGKQPTNHNSSDDFAVPFTARSVDNKGTNEFTHHYEGMYDDLQTAQKLLEENKTSGLSVSVDALPDRNSSQHAADNPYASIRYDRKTLDAHNQLNGTQSNANNAVEGESGVENTQSKLTNKNVEQLVKNPSEKFAHGSIPGVAIEKKLPRRLSQGEIRRSEIMGQNRFYGADNKYHSYFNLKVVFEPNKTGFEEQKHFTPTKGTVIAGRYQVSDVLGSAAFSTALQCADLIAEEDEPKWVCLKVIKNNKDFFDQSMDEIKLLQYINSHCEPDEKHVLRLIDFFYYKEHLFIVSELLRENLYEFGRYVREEGLEPYYTLPRLKLIMKQILEALNYIHSLGLIHCDVKPENIVVKSYSRCEVKLIDFGSSCFTTDNLTTYIQSRSYRAPEVIIGHLYDGRIDVWSVGAVLAELYTGYVLFQNDSVPTMLARIAGILGPIPHEVLMNGKETYKYYTSSAVVYEKAEEQTVSLVYPKQTTLEKRLHFDKDTIEPDEALFVDFVRYLLDLDPLRRPTAEETLSHAWLQNLEKLHIPAPKLTHPTAANKNESST